MPGTQQKQEVPFRNLLYAKQPGRMGNMRPLFQSNFREIPLAARATTTPVHPAGVPCGQRCVNRHADSSHSIEFIGIIPDAAPLVNRLGY